MKRNYTLLLFLLAAVSILAQTPEKMSYQVVLRDASNTLLTNQEVGMQISILQTTITGNAVYIETQTATTNINGLVSIAIGSGTSSNNFSAIDWSAGPYFIKTETDPSGGSSYTITGTSQIMSVPFALYAKTAGSAIPGPQGEPGATGAQGDIGVTGADGATGTNGTNGTPGIQGETGTAGTNGTQGETGAQGIQGETGPAGADGNDGADGTNGIDGAVGATGPQGAVGNDGVGIAQTLSQIGSDVTLSDGGGTVSVNDADADPTNELQSLNSVLTTNNDGGVLQVKNIADATDPQDAITKQQVDVLVLTIGPICKLQDLGYSVQEMYDIGNRTADEMWYARATQYDTESCILLADMVSAGIPVSELLFADIPIADLLDANADLTELINAGVGAQSLYDDYGYRVVDQLLEGVTLDLMVTDGMALQTVQEDSTITAYIAAGATAADVFTHNVKINGCGGSYCPTGDIERYYALDFLVDNGYTATQLLTKVSAIDLFHYSNIPISELYTINASTIPGILSTYYNVASYRVLPYISVSDLLNGGVPEATISAAALTPQQIIDLSIQVQLNAGTTPYQIYQSDNSLYTSIMGKIYLGGYITHLSLEQGVGPSGTVIGGTVIGKGFYAQVPDVGSQSGDYYPVLISGPQHMQAIDFAWDEGVQNTNELANAALTNTAHELNAARFCLDYEHGGAGGWALPDPPQAVDFRNNYWVNAAINKVSHCTSYNNMMHTAKIGTGNTVKTLTEGQTDRENFASYSFYSDQSFYSPNHFVMCYPTKNW
jgi:hypothetical protein